MINNFRRVFLVGLLLLGLPAWAGWSHIEYGGANYGGTRQSEDTKFRPSVGQHSLLIDFLSKKIEREGDEGVFYLNDLDAEAVHDAAQTLRGVAEERQWSRLHIVEVPGDYSKLDLPQTTSARNSHPHGSFFKEAATIERMTRLSATGLEIVTHYFRELGQLLAASGAYRWEKLGSAENYRFPSGRELYMHRLPVTNRRSFRYRLQIATDQELSWIKNFGSDVEREAGDLTFHWGRKARSDLVFASSNRVEDFAERYGEISMHPNALFGAGLYLSDNPYFYSNYGSDLFALRFNKKARFFMVAAKKVSALSAELKKRGWFLGIRDPAFHGLLRRAGYDGLMYDLIERINDRETFIFPPREGFLSAHRGDDFFASLIDHGVAERADVLSYANTFVALGYSKSRERLLEVLGGLARPTSQQKTALFALSEAQIMENRPYALRRWSFSEKIFKRILYRCESAVLRLGHWLGGHNRNFPE